MIGNPVNYAAPCSAPAGCRDKGRWSCDLVHEHIKKHNAHATRVLSMAVHFFRTFKPVSVRTKINYVTSLARMLLQTSSITRILAGMNLLGIRKAKAVGQRTGLLT